jgi:hypothetical protein
MGFARLMKSVFWKTLYAVLCGGMGSFSRLIQRFIRNGFKTAKGILKTLYGLSKAIQGDDIGGVTKMTFLLQKVSSDSIRISQFAEV